MPEKDLLKYNKMPENDSFFAEVTNKHKNALEKGEFTYKDPAAGFIVFTALYHVERGYCCGSGCRHCPYNSAFEDG